VFNPNSQPRFSVDKLVAICLQRAWEFFLIVGPSTTSRASVPIWVRWTPPIPGWIKLNTDGSSNGNLGPVGGGGVICDHEGNWLRGFARHIGSASSVVAELWALRDGLSLVIDMDFLIVLIEIDAFIVVSFLSTNAPRHPCLSSLVDDCRYLLQRIPQNELKHVFREANKCADSLANLGRTQEEDFVVFDSPLILFVMPFILITRMVFASGLET
jgi:ribonuclease HI